MPTGSFTIIPEVINEIMRLNPKSILDIGPGFGKWGVLFREYLELWGHRQYHKETWTKQIDCCEVFRPYITELHNFIYSNVIVKDIRDYVKEMPNYDVIVLIDVIEHFEKEEGIKLIEDLFKKTNKAVIIGTPLKFSPQKAAYGNIYETHKSLWTMEEFISMGFKKLGNFERPVLVIREKT